MVCCVHDAIKTAEGSFSIRIQDALNEKSLSWGNEACLAGMQGVVKYACSEEVPEPVDLQGLLLPFL